MGISAYSNVNGYGYSGNVQGYPYGIGDEEKKGYPFGVGKDGKDKQGGYEECETCKHRKYVDGSNEMVSYKSPTHISPQAAPGAVRAHEGEHVANAYKKAASGNGKVVSATVSIHTSVCPECGRTYVSGGTTNTQIKYYNEENPYQQILKAQDATKYAGMNMDVAL